MLCLPFQSCHRAPPLDPPARPPSSRFPLPFFPLSSRRVPLPLSSGPKAPLHLPAPVATEMDSEVIEESGFGEGSGIMRSRYSGAHGGRASISVLLYSSEHLITEVLELSWWFTNAGCAGLILYLVLDCYGGVRNEDKPSIYRAWN